MSDVIPCALMGSKNGEGVTGEGDFVAVNWHNAYLPGAAGRAEEGEEPMPETGFPQRNLDGGRGW